QKSAKMRFTTHHDGDPDGTWGPLETALGGPEMADDHINMKTVASDPSGKLFAVVKTSKGDLSTDQPTDPLIVLLVRDQNGGWTNAVFSTVADGQSRPMLLLNPTTRTLYVFSAPVSAGKVYMKSTSMDAP